MSDLDDEDVIFQGSPLYDSLISTGSLAQDLNIEVLKRDGCDSGKYDCQSSSLHTHKTRLQVQSASVKQKAGSLWTRLLAWLGIISKQEMARQKDVEIVTSLLQSSTLEEDDSDFLLSYLDIPKVSSKPGVMKHALVSLFLLMTPVPCALCLNSLYITKAELDWPALILTIASATLTVATLPLSVLYLGHVTDWSGLRKGLHGEAAAVKQFVKTGEGFLASLKRSLRFIQETELIARGFTLVSQKNPVSRLEVGSGGTRQCPGLRRMVFLVAREAIYSTRELTQRLINLETSGLITDMKSSYLAFEPIQSYGPCLQLEMEGASEELYTLTDGFSVYALKGICHLLQLHQSDFLKALALTYSHSFKHQDTAEIRPLINAEVLELLDPANRQFQAWTDTVQESYTFHSCSLLSRQPSRPITKPSSPVEDVYTAIHSLDLHLQSALTRVRTFSSILEAKINEGDFARSGFQGDDPVSEIMQPIRAEIESCKCCWEEGLTRLEKMLGKCYPYEKAEDNPDQSDLREDLQESATGQAKKIEDYIIEDQVFEAYTDPTEANLDEGDWEQPLTAEEKEKKKREKAEALRMLTELKSVISVRAVDREKREQAAILRAHPELAKRARPESGSNQSDLTDLKSKLQTDGTQSDLTDVRASPVTSANTSADLVDRKSSCKAESLKQSSLLTGNPHQELSLKSKPETGSNQTDRTVLKYSTETSENKSSDLDKKSSCKIESLKQSSQLKENLSKPDINMKEAGKWSGSFSEGVVEIDLGSGMTNFPGNTAVKQNVDKTKHISQRDLSDKSDHVSTGALTSCEENLDDYNASVRKPLSIVTSQGVRRLRKSNMLDLSDSDSDFDEEINSSHAEKDWLENEEEENLDIEIKKQRCGLPPLPFFNNKPQVCETGRESDDEHAMGTEDIDDYIEKPVLTLEERLRQYSGANLMTSSSLAAEAVAKSRMMGKMEEATFGGEVFGELSSSEDENNDQS